MHFLSVICCFSWVLLASSQSGCPEEWDFVASQCIRYFPRSQSAEAPRLTRERSEFICAENQAHLLAPTNEEIRVYLARRRPEAGQYAIGASRDNSERFYWFAGGRLLEEDPIWGPGEPQFRTRTSEYCVKTDLPASPVRIFDIPCDDRTYIGVFCQRPAIPPPRPPAGVPPPPGRLLPVAAVCPVNFVPLALAENDGFQCVQLFDNSGLDRVASEAFCSARSATVVAAFDPVIVAYLNSRSPRSGSIHVAASRPSNVRMFSWLPQSRNIPISNNSPEWGPNEPHFNNPSAELCVKGELRSTGFRIFDIRCDTRTYQSVVCQRDRLPLPFAPGP